MTSTTATLMTDSGVKVIFQRLTIPDLFSLVDEIQAEREVIARKLAKEEALDKLDTLNLVDHVRNNKPTVRDLFTHSESPQGAVKILTKSLRLAGVSEANIPATLAEFNFGTLIEVAKMLALDMQEVPKEAKETERPLEVVSLAGGETQQPTQKHYQSVAPPPSVGN